MDLRFPQKIVNHYFRMSKTFKDVWTIDIIDKFLLYSAIKGNNEIQKYSSYFQLASFSVQTSVKIYKNRINSLLDLTKNFLFFLKQNKNKIIYQRIKENQSFITENSDRIPFIEKLSSNFLFGNKWFGLFTPGIFNFFRRNPRSLFGVLVAPHCYMVGKRYGLRGCYLQWDGHA